MRKGMSNHNVGFRYGFLVFTIWHYYVSGGLEPEIYFSQDQEDTLVPSCPRAYAE